MHNCHSENDWFTANSNKRSVEQWFGNSASRALGKPNSVEVTCRPTPAAVCGNRFFRDPESYSGVEIQLYKLSVLMLQAQNHSYFLYVVAIHTEGTFSYGLKTVKLSSDFHGLWSSLLLSVFESHIQSEGVCLIVDQSRPYCLHDLLPWDLCVSI